MKIKDWRQTTQESNTFWKTLSRPKHRTFDFKPEHHQDQDVAREVGASRQKILDTSEHAEIVREVIRWDSDLEIEVNRGTVGELT